MIISATVLIRKLFAINFITHSEYLKKIYRVDFDIVGFLLLDKHSWFLYMNVIFYRERVYELLQLLVNREKLHDRF